MLSGKETYRTPDCELFFESQGTTTPAVTEFDQGDLNEPKTCLAGTNNLVQIIISIKKMGYIYVHKKLLPQGFLDCVKQAAQTKYFAENLCTKRKHNR